MAFFEKSLSKILRRFFNIEFSFSQEGEDRILERLLENKVRGFYIDVGANHPRRFSNTYLFYLKGWRGICIDPNSDMASLFAKIRPMDKFVNVGVSDEEGELEFIKYNENALNTFDQELTDWRLKNTPYKVIERKKIKVLKLSNILDSCEVNCEIDFMNIDVEGFDLNVLKSNNWDKYKPKIVLAENLEQVQSPLKDYLLGKNYKIVAMTKNTLFFLGNNQ